MFALPEQLWDFLGLLASQPRLALVVGLTVAVIVVNGATDAPNAIAAAVGSGALSFPRACALAALCNLAGVVLGTIWSGAVAQTIHHIARFGDQPGQALTGLCAALAAIVIWAVAAWQFGIPTSESHALVAGLSGAALAMPGGWSNLRPGPWLRVGLGLALSVGLGLVLGEWAARRLARLGPGAALCRRVQTAGACAAALLHGAQDGQKFLGVLLLALSLAGGAATGEATPIPLWGMGGCALAMALGTALGGRRIVDRVGRELAPLTLTTGLAADLGGALALLLCTALGLPVSTTHTKTAAVLGAGGAGGSANLACARSIGLTWLLTFPGCGAIGYIMATLLLRL